MFNKFVFLDFMKLYSFCLDTKRTKKSSLNLGNYSVPFTFKASCLNLRFALSLFHSLFLNSTYSNWLVKIANMQ